MSFQEIRTALRFAPAEYYFPLDMLLESFRLRVRHQLEAPIPEIALRARPYYPGRSKSRHGTQLRF